MIMMTYTIPHNLKHAAEMMLKDIIDSKRVVRIWINLDNSGAKQPWKFGTGVKFNKFPKFMLIIGKLQ